jgi:hypothetical protein
VVNEILKQSGRRKPDALPRPDVVGLGHRLAYNFPSQEMTHLPQVGGFTVPHSADVQGKKRHEKFFTITADRNLSPKRYGAFSEGLNYVKR